MTRTYESLREEIAANEARVGEGGGRARQERHRKLGRLLARERIDALCDSGSFFELGRHVTARLNGRAEVMAPHLHPGDGVVAGLGTVAGRPVAVYAHDPTVLRGAMGREGARKVCRLLDLALERKLPVVALVDCDGVRLEEGTDAIEGYGEILHRTALLKGHCPQVTLVCGLCVGAAAYAAALTDCVGAIEGQSYMFITGPTVTRAVTGEEVSLEDLGGAAMHARKTGACHAVLDDERTAIEWVQRVLGAVVPTQHATDPAGRLTPELEQLVPIDEKKPYKVLRVIEAIFDAGSALELNPAYGASLLTAFVRLNGQAVAVLASNPHIQAGCLDIDASRKGAAFVQWASELGLPIITLVDVPGYLPGRRQEEGGIIPHGATLISAFSNVRVPVVSLILRKSFGGANVLSFAAQVRLALPTARIGPIGADAAFEVLYGPEPKDEAERSRRRERKQAWLAEHDTAFAAARSGYVERVIVPAEARVALGQALASVRRPSTER